MPPRLRRNRTDRNSTSFAAAPINMTTVADRRYLATALGVSRHKSQTVWDWHDRLGLIHYGVSRVAKVAGFAELGVYKIGKTGEVESQVTGGIAGRIGEDLYSPYGGERGFIERFITLMKLPGDSYLIECLNDGVADGYDFCSADEIKIGDGAALLDTTSGTHISRITLPSKGRWGEDTLEERISASSFIGRVWRPAPRFVDLPDSAMFALEAECDMLHLLILGLRAKLLSRLAMNGIIYVPSEVNDVISLAATGDIADMHSNKTINELLKAAVYAMRNPSDSEAGIPIFLSGPGDQAENLKHIVLDQELYETDMKLRAELAERILVGLDVQPAQVRGTDDSNHWSAWAASEDELRVAIKPDLDVMCWALTRLVLWPRMEAAGLKPGHIQKHVIGYDLSKAASHINIAEDARAMREGILISAEATRRASGFEERDAPDDMEYIRMVGLKANIPYLATYGMAEAKNFDWEKIAPTKTGPDAQPKPGKGPAGSPGGQDSDTPKHLRPA